MQILHFAPNAAPVPMTDLPLPVTDGYAWVDLDRDQAQGWVERLQVAVDPQHLSDSLNAVHPSFLTARPTTTC